jgi:hypothetical protein
MCTWFPFRAKLYFVTCDGERQLRN